MEMVEEDLRPSKILTRTAFENGVRSNAAPGGSTNAVIHLLALARRVGVKLNLDDFDTLGRDIPTIADLMPSGQFLMEDFEHAGAPRRLPRNPRNASRPICSHRRRKLARR